MPKAYFEPENLNALAEILNEAERRLSALDVNDPATLDLIASRILKLAAEGMPPYMILREIVERKSILGGANEATHSTASPHIQQS